MMRLIKSVPICKNLLNIKYNLFELVLILFKIRRRRFHKSKCNY